MERPDALLDEAEVGRARFGQQQVLGRVVDVACPPEELADRSEHVHARDEPLLEERPRDV